jgi:hypothetical protein
MRGFAVAAVGLLVTAPLLVLSADAIAVEGALTETFVGTLLVGLTTSFPEMAATFAAVRLGALDLALLSTWRSVFLVQQLDKVRESNVLRKTERCRARRKSRNTAAERGAERLCAQRLRGIDGIEESAQVGAAPNDGDVCRSIRLSATVPYQGICRDVCGRGRQRDRDADQYGD